MALYLALFLIAMQVADAATTYFILNNGGRELNPLMDKLFQEVGVKIGLGVSKGLAIVIIILAYTYTPIWLLGSLSALYALIIANNTYHVVKIWKNK